MLKYEDADPQTKNKFQEFKKNYTGMIEAWGWFNYQQDCVKIEARYKDATYSESYNRQLVAQAKEQSFNRNCRR